MKSLELHEDRYNELRSRLKNGYFVNCCNNWLCPFNNKGICIVPENDCIDNEELDKDLNKLYNISSSLDENEVNQEFEDFRNKMIEKYDY